jgi:hypothetical protein
MIDIPGLRDLLIALITALAGFFIGRAKRP